MARKRLKDLLLEIRNLPANHEDALIVVDGNERVGKSTLIYKISRLLDPTYDHTRVSFSARDYKDLSLDLPPGSVCHLDEAIAGAFSRDAMKGDNKELVKYLIVCGERYQIHFITIPNIHWLDPYLRLHRCKYWIHIPERGRAVVHHKLRNPYGQEVYWEAILEIEYGPEESQDWDLYEKRKHDMVGQFRNRANPVTSGQQILQVIQDDLEVSQPLLRQYLATRTKFYEEPHPPPSKSNPLRPRPSLGQELPPQALRRNASNSATSGPSNPHQQDAKDRPKPTIPRRVFRVGEETG